MHNKTCLVVVGVVALAFSAFGGYIAHYEKESHQDPAHYNFEYKVHDPHTGDVKSQHETREGDVVKGYYTFKEADGTTREVHYTADKLHGFQAQVKRIGTPVEPKKYQSYHFH